MTDGGNYSTWKGRYGVIIIKWIQWTTPLCCNALRFWLNKILIWKNVQSEQRHMVMGYFATW